MLEDERTENEAEPINEEPQKEENVSAEGSVSLSEQSPSNENEGSSTKETAPVNDRYSKYIMPGNENASAEGNGFTWQGSTYSGRPNVQNEYGGYQNGYAPNGYSQGNAGPANGYASNGYACENTGAQGGYAPNGYAQGGYPQNSYAQNGYPQGGYTQAGNQNGYAPNGYPQGNAGAQGGYPQNGAYANHYQGYQGNAYAYQGAPGYVYQKPPKKQRKPMPRAVAAILYALVFGIVACGTMYGGNKLIGILTPEETPAPVVADVTAPNEKTPFIPKIQPAQTVSGIDTTPADVSAIVEAAAPSIVQINCTFTVNSIFGVYESKGAGSGIIIEQNEKELLIATNNHVVEGAKTIEVGFADGNSAGAILKGNDSVADLAVIAIKLDDLSEEIMSSIKVATLGDSNKVKVGQMAIAIGNALGYGQATTVGYISAKDREVTVDGKKMTLLQTDAAINPGNSGGALLNIKGEVIGINSVKYASSEVEGMGFAIPITRAIDILLDLGSREILAEEEKGYLGVTMRNITEDEADKYNCPVGVYVAQLTENGAAYDAGIKKGDIITAVDGNAFTTAAELKEYITSKRIGTDVKVTLQRRIDGEFEEMEITVTLRQNPDLNTEKDPNGGQNE